MKMKKLMIAAAAALWATVGFGDVESANIVGYTQKDAPKGQFKIYGAGFEQVGGGSAVNGLVSGVEGVSYDEENVFRTTAAQIQIPNAEGGYDVYYYLNDGWFDDNGADGYKAGWCDDNGVIVDTEVTPGVAFWFKSVPSDAMCTVSGQVSLDTSAEVTCPQNFALRANPFPVSVAVNSGKFASSDIVGVNYDEENVFRTTAPQIQIPNAEGGYDVCYYLTDGWFDDNGADGYKAGWCDDNGVIVDTEIPAGQGIWTKGVTGAFTLMFTK